MKINRRLPANVWVVVPAYNETTYIQTVLRKVLLYTRQIVVVDDGSSDQTAVLARQLVKHVLVHPVNLGKGVALKTGCDFVFEYLKGKSVVLLDADDQHDPAALPAFMQALKRNQVVFGVRDFKTMPWMRALGNRFGSVLIGGLFGRYFRDIPSGYKAFTQAAYRQLRWHSSGYSVEMEIAARAAKYNLRVAEVPIPTIYHDFSRGMTMLDTLAMIIHVLTWKVSL